MRRAWWMSGVGVIAVLVAAGCGQRQSGTDAAADGGRASEPGDEGPCPGVAEADRTKVVAEVGTTKLTVCDVTEALNKMSPYLRKAYEAPQKRRQFVDNMIRFELIAQEAARRGYADDEEVQRVEKQMMIQRLNKELQESVRLSDITEEEMRAYYEEHARDYHKAEMVRIARILLGSEADCDKVLSLAREKATDSRYFRELAREHSTDERTKEHGGDLPYFPRTEERSEGDPEMDEAIVAAAFELDMREPLYGKCVKTSEGWNVIRLRGRRKARDLSYEDVERQIRHRLHRDRLSKARDDLVTKLRKNAEITINEEALAKIRIEAPEVPAAGPPEDGPLSPGGPFAPGERPMPGAEAPAPGKAPGLGKAPGPLKAPGLGKAPGPLKAPGPGKAPGPLKAPPAPPAEG